MITIHYIRNGQHYSWMRGRSLRVMKMMLAALQPNKWWIEED